MPLFFDPLKTRAGDGTEGQWVDGGVRDVTPLSAALQLNPRGVIAVRASPAPQPGPVRTFGNLIDIGLRAVDILQSEVSANDLAGAALVNDLIAAREAKLRALQADGDRKRVVSGKSVSVRVDLGGRRINTKKNNKS